MIIDQYLRQATKDCFAVSSLILNNDFFETGKNIIDRCFDEMTAQLKRNELTMRRGIELGRKIKESEICS